MLSEIPNQIANLISKKIRFQIIHFNGLILLLNAMKCDENLAKSDYWTFILSFDATWNYHSYSTDESNGAPNKVQMELKTVFNNIQKNSPEYTSQMKKYVFVLCIKD